MEGLSDLVSRRQWNGMGNMKCSYMVFNNIITMAFNKQ